MASISFSEGFASTLAHCWAIAVSDLSLKITPFNIYFFLSSCSFMFTNCLISWFLHFIGESQTLHNTNTKEIKEASEQEASTDAMIKRRMKLGLSQKIYK